ncbi:hypothetical protein [Stieleria varia]|uniref:Uncharacterized protein n=1 Tax=Stieleria varia TaxID=2528005 RepID=A0A5C5ZIM4_9BACT|nr:hypothetical protein [Stieleria varia]TWT87000.1 hypothetical protein Pla52n_70570 [Stieleria varia]
MNAIHYAIGGALFGVGIPLAMWWNGTAQPSNWVWLVSGVFGGLCGAFFVLAMRLTTPEIFTRTLTTRETTVVKLLMIPTIIGALLLFIGQGTMPSREDEIESPQPIILMLIGILILLFPILIGGTMSLIVQLSSPRNTAEPTHAPKDAS